jgi:hypothetical protein
MKVEIAFEINNPTECRYRRNGECGFVGPYNHLECDNDNEFPKFCILRQLNKTLHKMKRNFLGEDKE